MVIDDLRGIHRGETCWVIGKGASLERLRRADIGDGVVIAISDSIIVVERFGIDNLTYSLQQDGCSSRKTNWEIGERPAALPPHASCHPAVPRPQRATLIVSKFLSPNCLADYAPRLMLDPRELGLVECLPSAHIAPVLARWMDCSRIVFLCFDNHENGDTRTYEAHLRRVVQRGDFCPTNAEQYRGISRDLDLMLADLNLPFEFVTPE